MFSTFELFFISSFVDFSMFSHVSFSHVFHIFLLLLCLFFDIFSLSILFKNILRVFRFSLSCFSFALLFFHLLFLQTLVRRLPTPPVTYFVCPTGCSVHARKCFVLTNNQSLEEGQISTRVGGTAARPLNTSHSAQQSRKHGTPPAHHRHGLVRRCCSVHEAFLER